MRLLAVYLAACLAASSTATPFAGQDVPISESEYASINALALSQRSAAQPVKRGVDQPISNDEMDNIDSLQLSQRSNDDIAIEARDSRSNCAQKISNKDGSSYGTAGGNGIWCPLDQYFGVVNSFCNSYQSTDIHQYHETSDTYGITLTNQKDPTAVGPPGNIVLAIYILYTPGSWVVDTNTCVNSMLKQSNTHSKCYGKKHNDTEGGYWKVDSIGLFGAEVYSGAPPS